MFPKVKVQVDVAVVVVVFFKSTLLILTLTDVYSIAFFKTQCAGVYIHLCDHFNQIIGS